MRASATWFDQDRSDIFRYLLVAHRGMLTPEGADPAGDSGTPGDTLAAYDDTITWAAGSRENVVIHELGHTLLGQYHSLPGFQGDREHNPRLGHFIYIEPSAANYDDDLDGVQDVYIHSEDLYDAMATGVHGILRWSDYKDATWRALLPWLWRRPP